MHYTFIYICTSSCLSFLNARCMHACVLANNTSLPIHLLSNASAMPLVEIEVLICRTKTNSLSNPDPLFIGLLSQLQCPATPTIYSPIFFIRILPRTLSLHARFLPTTSSYSFHDLVVSHHLRRMNAWGIIRANRDQRHCRYAGERDVFARGHVIVRAIRATEHGQKASKLQAGLSLLRRHQGPDPA